MLRGHVFVLGVCQHGCSPARQTLVKQLELGKLFMSAPAASPDKLVKAVSSTLRESSPAPEPVLQQAALCLGSLPAGQP